MMGIYCDIKLFLFGTDPSVMLVWKYTWEKIKWQLHSLGALQQNLENCRVLLDAYEKSFICFIKWQYF